MRQSLPRLPLHDTYPTDATGGRAQGLPPTRFCTPTSNSPQAMPYHYSRWSLVVRAVVGASAWLVWALAAAAQGLPARPTGSAAPRLVQQLNVGQGLSHRLVHCLLQDRQGFLWFGTNNGLDRFDGYGLRSITALAQGPSLLRPPVYCLLEDAVGRLWIGSEGGLHYWTPTSGQLRAVAVPAGPPAVHSLARRSGGGVWAGTVAGGLNGYDAAGRLELARPPAAVFGAGRAASALVGLHVLAGGQLLAETYGGAALLLSAAGGPLRVYHRSGPALRLAGVEPTGRLRLVSGRQLLLTGAADTTLQPLATWRPDLPPSFPAQAVGAAGGRLWVGATLAELLSLDPARPAAPTHRPGPALVVARGGNVALNALLPDRAGHLWAATDDGVLQLDLAPARFAVLAPPAGVLPPGQQPSTRGVAVLDGHLYVGTYAGLFCQNLGTRQWRRLPFRWPQAPAGTPEPVAYALWPDPARRCLWLGCEGAGLVRYQPDRSAFTFLEAPEGPTGTGNALNFAISLTPTADRAGLWVGSYTGLRRYDISTGRFRTIDGFAQLGLREVKVWTLAPATAPGGAMWAGTSQGLFLLDSAGRIRQRWQARPGGLPGQDVLCLWPEPGGRSLWLGTRGGGLWRLQLATGHWQSWRTAQGLAHDLVCSLVPEGDSALWLGTQQGLARLRRRTGTFTNYGTRDGLPADEFNHGAAAVLPDGRLLLGGLAGLGVVQPRQLPAVPAAAAAPVLLTGLSYYHGPDGTLVRHEQLPPGGLQLAPTDRLLTVGFALADFREGAQHQYAYQLAGLESQWVPLGPETTLRLAALPVGRYELRVRGAGPDGRWSPHQLRLPLVVPPVFYRTWWFGVLLVGALAGLFYGLFRYRLRRVLLLERLRTQIAANLHDEVGSLLTRIAVQADFMQQLPPAEPPPPALGLDRLADTARAAIASMADVVWSIDARRETLADLLGRMREQLQHLLGPLDIAWELTIADDALTRSQLAGTRQLPTAWRQNVYLIFKEALNNVVRHAPRPTVVRVALHCPAPRRLVLTIGNATGAAPDASAPPAATWPVGGQGLLNMQLRARQLGGTVQAGPVAPNWEVRLEVPL